MATVDERPMEDADSIEEGPSHKGDDSLYEVIGGSWDLKSVGIYQMLLASTLCEYLKRFAREAGLGTVVMEGLFDLGRPDGTQRRPDLAFVSYERWPRGKRVPKTAAWDVRPDLAIEIISPTNRAAEMNRKVADYFEAGVRAVWIVYDDPEQVHQYDAPESVRIVGLGGTLDGGAQLPGFQMPLAMLFAEDVPPN